MQERYIFLVVILVRFHTARLMGSSIITKLLAPPPFLRTALSHMETSSATPIKKAAAAVLPLTDRVQEALAVAKRGADELLIESEFAQKLARSEQSGVPRIRRNAAEDQRRIVDHG